MLDAEDSVQIMKIQRNARCPCGSGKKFKACCAPGLRRPPTVQASVAARFIPVRHLATDARRYEHVKSFITGEITGQRIVVVGRDILVCDKSATVTDVLFDYPKHVFGADWWRSEAEKSIDRQHQVVRWWFHVVDQAKSHQPGPSGVCAMEPDGVTCAYLLLAYDLYVLRHHLKLQASAIQRLKHPDQFQGARFELLVTATLIRAGWQIEFEDETDVTQKHSELTAIHQSTGARLSVEAKSRHREGVLGQPGNPVELKEVKLGLHRLMRKASAKQSGLPLIVFVDLNVPPERLDRENGQWRDELRSEVSAYLAEFVSCPIALLVAMNCPHHYAPAGEAESLSMAYLCRPTNAVPPLPDWQIASEIEDALMQHGRIPNFFPDTVPPDVPELDA